MGKVFQISAPTLVKQLLHFSNFLSPQQVQLRHRCQHLGYPWAVPLLTLSVEERGLPPACQHPFRLTRLKASVAARPPEMPWGSLLTAALRPAGIQGI